MSFTVVDWFYVQNGKQIGPVPVAQFDDLVQSGRISAETLVWREGLVNWQAFGSIRVTSLRPPLQSASPPLPGAPPPVLTGARTSCAECGLEFPASEMIPFEGLWICAKCKPIFLQRVREGAALAGGGANAWQSGNAVVTLLGAKLPARCVRCNGPATGEPIPRKVYWQSSWLYLLLLMPPIYVIVHLIVHKRARVSVPICEEHRQRRRIFIGVSWSLAAITIVVVIAANTYASEALMFLAIVIASTALTMGYANATLVSADKIDSKYVWLHGFCKEYRASLPEFPDWR